jgi:hypothetical protein
MALGPDHSRPGLSHRVLRGPDSQNRSSAGPVMLDSLSGFFCPGSETVIEDSVLKAHVAEEKKNESSYTSQASQIVSRMLRDTV